MRDWRLLGACIGLLISGLLFGTLNADAQESNRRVLWQLDFDNGLSKTEQNVIESTMIKTLSRASERHFVGDSIIEQKIKREGLNFPACFTEGTKCSQTGALLLDVHNVDAYAKAVFSKHADRWQMDLTLYRNQAVAPSKLSQSDPNLENLIESVAGSMFTIESVLEITSTIPDVEIYINKTYAGNAPQTIKTSAGKHDIVFKKEGYVDETWSFTAQKGKIHKKEINLVPKTVKFTVLVTDPDADVFIDDQPWGKANETHNILPGNHHISIRSARYHGFEMDHKVYAGNPQDVHFALLPISEDHYSVRHRGISKYRFSLGIGYHFAHQSYSLSNVGVKADESTFYPQQDKWAKSFFHGFSFAANYEAEYWGISILKFDFGYSGITTPFIADNQLQPMRRIQGTSEGAIFMGVYPAQIRGHYTLGIVQGEVAAGVGLSQLRLNAKLLNEINPELKHTFIRNAFSINVDVGFKVFLSEESYLFANYDFQHDFEPDHARSSSRHGLTAGFGYQLHFLLRDAKGNDDRHTDDITIPTDDDITVPNMENY